MQGRARVVWFVNMDFHDGTALPPQIVTMIPGAA
jgi:hypothetical protein